MKAIHAVLGLAAALAAASPALAQAPQKGGTLVYAISQGEPATFDCHAAGSINVMLRVSPHYSTLLQIDPDNYPKVVGDLAQSWTISPDGLTYTFKLRGGVTFHDGSALTSNDVKVSLDRMRNPPAGVISLRKEMLRNITAIDTPDAGTVVITIDKPNPTMLQLLALPYGCVYSAKLLAADADYPAKKVMGSGPFRFTSYTPGVEWVGQRYENYFDKTQPYLDGFKALSLAPAATVNALTAGQVMLDFRGVSRAEAERIVAQRGDKVRIFEAGKAIALPFLAAINNQKPPFNDVRVRRALALAIDHWNGAKVIERSSTISGVGGLLRPGSSFARSEEELAKLPGFSRDMEAARAEARKLLAEAGQSDLKITFLNRKPWPFLGVFLADQLRQIGVTVTHEQAEDPQFFSRRASGAYDLILEALPDFLDDPTVQWSAFRSVKNNPGNIARFDDADFDAMYDEQSHTVDAAKRLEIIRKAEAHLLNQAYVIPFFWGRRTTIVDAQLQGYVAAPTNYIGLDLSRFWLKP